MLDLGPCVCICLVVISEEPRACIAQSKHTGCCTNEPKDPVHLLLRQLLHDSSHMQQCTTAVLSSSESPPRRASSLGQLQGYCVQPPPMMHALWCLGYLVAALAPSSAFVPISPSQDLARVQQRVQAGHQQSRCSSEDPAESVIAASHASSALPETAALPTSRRTFTTACAATVLSTAACIASPQQASAGLLMSPPIQLNNRYFLMR